MSKPSDKINELSKGIKKPHDNDVLSGRGNYVNNFPGNIYFREIVDSYKIEYVASPKSEKDKYTQSIYRVINELKPPGRFLQQNMDTKLWEDIGKDKALRKIRQALREGAPVIMKALAADQKHIASGGVSKLSPSFVKRYGSVNSLSTSLKKIHVTDVMNDLGNDDSADSEEEEKNTTQKRERQKLPTSSGTGSRIKRQRINDPYKGYTDQNPVRIIARAPVGHSMISHPPALRVRNDLPPGHHPQPPRYFMQIAGTGGLKPIPTQTHPRYLGQSPPQYSHPHPTYTRHQPHLTSTTNFNALSSVATANNREATAANFSSPGNKGAQCSSMTASNSMNAPFSLSAQTKKSKHHEGKTSFSKVHVEAVPYEALSRPTAVWAMKDANHKYDDYDVNLEKNYKSYQEHLQETQIERSRPLNNNQVSPRLEYFDDRIGSYAYHGNNPFRFQFGMGHGVTNSFNRRGTF